MPKKQVDTTCRTGYSLIKAKPKTPQEMVTEYYLFVSTSEGRAILLPNVMHIGLGVCADARADILDRVLLGEWLPSLLVPSFHTAYAFQANNFTYDVDQGGFSDTNLFSIDQRGFKHLIQAEAQTFLSPAQTLLNATVRTIAYSDHGVVVTLANGTRITADYAITTFSLGVLQNDDVLFEPPLPTWKQEAIQSMTMVRFRFSGSPLALICGRRRTRRYSCNSRKISGSTHRCIKLSAL